MISAFDPPATAQRAASARESARFYADLAERCHPAFARLVPVFEREAERQESQASNSP